MTLIITQFQELIHWHESDHSRLQTATFNTYGKKYVVFRRVNTYNNDFWTNFGLSVNPQTWSPPRTRDHRQWWKRKYIDVTGPLWIVGETQSITCANIGARIGVPHIFVGWSFWWWTRDWGEVLLRYVVCGSFYNVVWVNRWNKRYQEWINNIQSIYDDVAKNEKSTKPTDQLIQSVDTDTKLETEWKIPCWKTTTLKVSFVRLTPW